MRIGIIHLSDLHINKDYCHNNGKDELLIETLKKHQLDELDKLYLIMTGDLADGGEKKEYDQVTKFINSLKKKCDNQFANGRLEIIVVPGNHDICFESGYTDNLNRFKTNNYYSIQERKKEIKRFNNFYNFSNKYDLFTGDNKVVDIKTLDINNFTINFCLINSSLYSLKESQADKAYHHLSEDEISSIEQSSNANINIMVLHHDFNWFDWETRTKLESICNKYYSIILYGHEHYEKITKTTCVENLDSLYIQADESFKEKKFDNFSFYILDTELRTIDISIFKLFSFFI